MFFTRLNSTGEPWKSGDARGSPWPRATQRLARAMPARARRSRHAPRTVAVASPRAARARRRARSSNTQRDRHRRRTGVGAVDPRPSARRREGATSIGPQLRQIDQDRARSPAPAPQTERIARAGRPFAGREQPDQRVELVGQRHRGPGDGRGARAARVGGRVRLRRRPAGSGSRSPSRPPRAPSSRA